ncbi:MAG: Cof-type HAD-IIB family hydrolase [Succiniclasticum sp.]
MAIKLIASDMDDTLLNSKTKLSERNAAAIRKAIDAGIVFLIATGRMYVSVKPYADTLGLDVPLVTYNGALVKGSKSGKVYYEHPLKLETALELLAYCKEKGYYIQSYQGDELWVKEATEFSAEYTRISGIPATPVGERLYHPETAPYKLLAMTKPEEFQKVWQDIQQQFAGKVVVTSSRDNFLELMEPGVNKWNAVKAVAEVYGIKPEEIMCIGDSNNDLSMIENAGIGVAVANAKPAVRAAAKLVTVSNDEDGVAQVIEQVLLSE